MARFTATITDYMDAEKFLGSRDGRKIANNTQVIRIDTHFCALRLHWTNVVVWGDNGGMWLNTGGHHTTTTKQRINESLPPGWGVFAKDFDWFLQYRPTGDVLEFFDGMPVKLPTDYTDGDREAVTARKLYGIAS